MFSVQRVFSGNAFFSSAVAFFFLFSATGCTLLNFGGTQHKTMGGTGDPIQGKYATISLGRAIGPGGDFSLPDGRSYSLTLVKSIAKDGSEEYFVTADKDGAVNENSILVPTPNTPFKFSLTSNGDVKSVAVWSTEGISVPFEALDSSLQGTGMYVDRLVKVPGTNGRGSILLAHTTAPPEGSTEGERTLVNVYLNGSVETQTVPGPATQSVVNGLLRFNRTTEAGQSQRVDFMEVDSPTSGKVGFSVAGQETSEPGQLFGMAPRILEPTRNHRAIGTSLVAKWSRVPNAQGEFPAAHKVLFIEIIRGANGNITRNLNGAFFEYILPTTANSPQENDVLINNLEYNKVYRLAVASCEAIDCLVNLRWAMVDFFGPVKKPESPVIIAPTSATSPLAPVVFSFRSASQASHDFTTHFEVWAGIYRNGKIEKRLTDVSQYRKDIWAPVHPNPLPSTFSSQTFSYTATPENVGDTVRVQVRACPDAQNLTAAPRPCSAWTQKSVTIQNP